MLQIHSYHTCIKQHKSRKRVFRWYLTGHDCLSGRSLKRFSFHVSFARAGKRKLMACICTVFNIWLALIQMNAKYWKLAILNSNFKILTLHYIFFNIFIHFTTYFFCIISWYHCHYCHLDSWSYRVIYIYFSPFFFLHIARFYSRLSHGSASLRR